MKPFAKCPVCGGELRKRTVEKLLKGGNNTAVMKVRAEVCMHCGERLYSEESVKRFEEVRAKLARKETREFTRIGQSYQVS